MQVTPLNMSDPKTVEVAEGLYRELCEIYNSSTGESMDVLIDDRDVRPGVKFKDADLIGIPIQVIIGEKGLKDNQIEIKIRRTGEAKKVSLDNAIKEILAIYYRT